jgi:hypothetical protein
MTGEDGKGVGWFWMLVVQYDIGFAIVVHCGFDTGTELLHVRTLVLYEYGRQGDDGMHMIMIFKGSRALSVPSLSILEVPSIMTKKAVHQNVDLGKTRSSDMKRKSFAAQQQTVQALRNLIEYKELAYSFTLKVDLFDLILYCSSTC